MKKKGLLSGQAVKKRHPKSHSDFMGSIRKVSSVSLKAVCLVTIVAVISFSFLFAYQYLINSPIARLEQVRFSGVDEKIKKELVELSKLDSEMSLLTLNLKAIKQKMERHPWVKAVVLEKNFPNQLIVRAEKQIPYAIVALDRLYYIDRQGVPFKELETDDNKDYPVITGISPNEADRDSYMKMAAEILTVFESDKGAWSISNLGELHFEGREKVSLYSTSIQVVLKGGYNEFAGKREELKKLLAHLTETGRINVVTAIDLDYSNGALVSFRDAG